MMVGVAAERLAGERRVALIPESVARLRAQQLDVIVSSGAGNGAWFDDDEYRRAGAEIADSAVELFSSADVIAKIHPPTLAETEGIRCGATVICASLPMANPALLQALVRRRITAIIMDRLPRTTLAQAMDVLTSQSTAAGYRAVIVAANELAKFFPMLMTPAGSIRPAKVLVMGAGVAGLQAIATARRLGAAVEAFDVRRATRRDVESLGARFIEPWIEESAETAEGYAERLTEAALARARQTLQAHLENADVCITTALVPNQPAPRLITAAMVERMHPGSVIVDLAALTGGNCELTEPGRDVRSHGVTIVGRIHLASELAQDASRMYARNMEAVLRHFIRDGKLRFDGQDEITRRCVVAHEGALTADNPAPLAQAS